MNSNLLKYLRETYHLTINNNNYINLNKHTKFKKIHRKSMWLVNVEMEGCSCVSL